MKEVIEKLILTDEELLEISMKPLSVERTSLHVCVEIAKAQIEKLLNAYYPCEECKGLKHTLSGVLKTCPSCEGTGQGERMIAVLAKEQATPRNPNTEIPYDSMIGTDLYTSMTNARHLGFEKTVELMTTPQKGEDGQMYVWKRVYEGR